MSKKIHKKNTKEVCRTSTIQLRVTLEEKENYLQLATEAGMDMSTFIRESIKSNGVVFIEKEEKSDENKTQELEVFNQRMVLYRLANNLNQLTRYSHQNKILHYKISSVVDMIKKILLERY